MDDCPNIWLVSNSAEKGFHLLIPSTVHKNTPYGNMVKFVSQEKRLVRGMYEWR